MTVVSASTPNCPIWAAKASASSRRLGTGGVLIDKSWRQCTKTPPGICPAAYKGAPRGFAAVGGTKRASIIRRLASCTCSTNHYTLTKIWRSGRRGIRTPCKEWGRDGTRARLSRYPGNAALACRTAHKHTSRLLAVVKPHVACREKNLAPDIRKQ